MASNQPLPPGASRSAIKHHYDVGNEFFFSFLDPETHTYSCALYAEGDDLAAAQQRKHDWHIDQAGARGAERVLDVGCGWGGCLRRMVTSAGVRHAVGLTLSEQQKKHIESLDLPGVEVHLQSWTDHQPDAAYDAIISMGAFEHFAKWKIPHQEKIESYRLYFQKCRELLKPGGRMTVQTMAYGDIPRDRVYGDEFIATDIFPESDFPRLADMAEACEGEFEVHAVRDDRDMYVRTYREWFNNLRANRERAIEAAGEEIYRRYERYLRMFSYSFGLGAFQLLRVTFRRLDYRRHATAAARGSLGASRVT